MVKHLNNAKRRHMLKINSLNLYHNEWNLKVRSGEYCNLHLHFTRVVLQSDNWAVDDCQHGASAVTR